MTQTKTTPPKPKWPEVPPEKLNVSLKGFEVVMLGNLTIIITGQTRKEFLRAYYASREEGGDALIPAQVIIPGWPQGFARRASISADKILLILDEHEFPIGKVRKPPVAPMEPAAAPSKA